MSVIPQKIQRLKAIINTVFQLDLTKKTRLKEYVDARIIFSYILKEQGLGSTALSKILKVNHATIHNYWKKYEIYMSTDVHLRNKNSMIREEYFNGEDPVYELNNLEIKNELILLRKKNKELSLENEKLNLEIIGIKKEEERWDGIMKMIKQRTRRNTEKEVEFKLTRFFNGVYE